MEMQRRGGVGSVRAAVAALAAFDLLDQPADLLGGEALVARNLLVFDHLAFLQRPESLADNAGEMNEHILAVRIDDESESLLGIEPLDGTGSHHKLLKFPAGVA